MEDIITEDQAWDFLTDASEVLHMLGAEILLPSWWQAIGCEGDDAGEGKELKRTPQILRRHQCPARL